LICHHSVGGLFTNLPSLNRILSVSPFISQEGITDYYVERIELFATTVNKGQAKLC